MSSPRRWRSSPLSVAALVLLLLSCGPNNTTVDHPTDRPNPTDRPASSSLVPNASVRTFVKATDVARWTADTGIYGTYDHWGPQSFICGVGYDLHFRGALPLESVGVALRYAPAFIARAGPAANVSADWVEPVELGSSGSFPVANPATVGHVSGAIGTVCPNGESDLDALRGSVLRVVWRENGVDHAEDLTVERLRGGLRIFSGELSTDGLPRLEWER